jgi:glycine cleavage system transcriptional repressor
MLIITAVGPDHPGMAHAVAQILFDAGCNIEDTTMTRLSGQFSMILAVTPPTDLGTAELTEKLAGLKSSHGLTLAVNPAEAGTAESVMTGGRYIVSMYGPEAKGLLARVTGVLEQHGANITDVQTRVASAGAVYVMLLEIELPADTTSKALEQALQAEAQASGLQLSLRALEEETL